MRSHFNKTLTDNLGNVLTNAQIRVLQAGSSVAIAQPLYVSNNSTLTLPNPFVCATGVIDFYLDMGQRIRLGVTPSGASSEIFFEDLDVVSPSFVTGVQDEGTSVPFRPRINFVGSGVTVTDDSAANSTTVTISGVSGSTTSGRWVRRVVASVDAPQAEKDAADYVCDGINDEVQVNQAISDVSSGQLLWQVYGGEVFLGAGSYTIGNGQTNNNGSIRIHSGIRLRGAGTRATWIKAAGVEDINGAFVTFAASTTPDIPTTTVGTNLNNVNNSGGMIELYSADTQFTEVSHLSLFGNSEHGARVMGVRYDQRAVTNKAVYEGEDAANNLNNLYIVDTAGHGLYQDGSLGGATKVHNIHVLNSGGTVEGNSSGIFTRIIRGQYSDIYINAASSHGIWNGSADSQWTNVKVFNCGTNGLATIYGAASGLWSLGRRNTFASLHTENNYGHGIAALGLESSFVGFVSRSNGRNISGSGVLISADGNTFFGNSSDPAVERAVSQKYGVEISNSVVLASGMISIGNSKVASYSGNFSPASIELTLVDQGNSLNSFSRLPGRVYQGIPTQAPTDANLARGTMSVWFDEVNNKLMFRVRRSTGAYQTGSIGVF